MSEIASNGDSTVRGKRQRSTNGSPSKSSKKKKEKGTSFVCPICTENIIESTRGRQGHDAVYCEGSCNTWLHRKCVGLTKTAYDNLDNDTPYICPHCQIQVQQNEIQSLKNTLTQLTKTMEELKAKLDPPAVSDNDS